MRRFLRRGRRRDERGYVILWIAASMVALLGITGFAVDLGYWYHRAAELQNAADAGALAGVVYMPGNFSQASSVASQAVGKNVTGAGSSASKVPGFSRRLNVCVSDSHVARFFSSIFLKDDLKISRCATAEYALPVALGSPLNVFDDAQLGVRASVNGYCTAKEDGDLLSSRYRATRRNVYFTACPPPPGESNAQYDSEGYWFAVDLDQPSPQQVVIELRHAAFFDGDDGDLKLDAGPVAIDTHITVYDATQTPLDYSDDPVWDDVVVHSGDNAWKGWHGLRPIPSGTVGRFRVQVRTVAGQMGSAGINSYGIRANPGGGAFEQCTTVEGDAGYSSTCPHVSGENMLSVFANAPGSTASFYLAEVDPVHAGREMVITLFDPGEGGKALEVLDPNGNPVSFRWRTEDDLSPQESGATSALDVSKDDSHLPGRSEKWHFNERLLKLTIELPDDYTDRYGDKTWWKLRYQFGTGSVTDRTTWGVEIIGQPVRLVPNP